MAIAGHAVEIALRNVLIATDFSECSQRALLHALGVARRYGSKLHLLHVITPSGYWMSTPESYCASPERLSEAVALARRDAERLIAEQARPLQGLQHRSWVATGAVWEVLREVVEHENIDMVFVGTHGRAGLRKMFLGSVAEDVFRHSPCPVLTVGPHAPGIDPERVQLKHVLFPTDLSDDSARALPYVASAVRQFGAALTVIHVVERPDAEFGHDRERVWRGLETKMRELIAPFLSADCDVQYAIEIGEAADIVIETATRRQADLIVLGLKAPDSFVDRLPWLKAYQIVRQVGCPVLTVRGASGRRGS